MEKVYLQETEAFNGAYPFHSSTPYTVTAILQPNTVCIDLLQEAHTTSAS